MTWIAEFTLPGPDFPLGRVFEEWPEARFELDRVVPSADTVMPYFWVYDADVDGVLAALEDLPELRSATLMEDLGDEGLFRAEWKPEFMGIMAAIDAVDVTVLSATGTDDGWTFELRAASGGAFSAFQRHCREHDIDVTLARLSRLRDATGAAEYDLTPAQREALVLAFEAGYYGEPRETDLETLASRLGISRPAFAARLRRGHRNLVGSTVASTGGD